MAVSVYEQMSQILEEYGEEVRDVARKNEIKSARASAKDLRNTSPKKSGDYASGWTAKQLDADTAVAYNRKMPGLTHLLENGHVIRNKKGDFGRAPAHPHIAPVEAKEGEQFVENIKRDLQR